MKTKVIICCCLNFSPSPKCLHHNCDELLTEEFGTKVRFIVLHDGSLIQKLPQFCSIFLIALYGERLTSL